jgi:preprotein translocase subunit SecD
LHLVLSWPVRVIVITLLIFALVVDGAGYFYRITNHYPLTGPVPGLPPSVLGVQLYFHRGLDLQGGTDLQLELSNFPPGQDRAAVQQKTIAVIDKRINALGVNEPVVQTAGNNHDRIEVQLAGVPASKAQSVIGRTAQLVTTKWVPDSAVTGGPWPGYRPQNTPLQADMLTSANAQLDPQGGTAWVVSTNYNSTGAAIFSQLTTDAVAACPTSDCAQRHITDWLDLTPDDIAHWNERALQLYKPFDQGGKLVTDPTIQNQISGGTAIISNGNPGFTQQSASDLATLLNSGSLPVKLTVIQSTDVGASLGQESVKKSLAAGLLGLMVVIIFMVAFYRLPGLLASLALLAYAGIVLALFKVFTVTLTLGGLAGFILSVGMAVDANVLIFERFKEEMRAGRTIGAAVDAAVRRAWPAIRDSNISTLITSGILAFAGTGPVRGFAITLMIGVAVSMLSSIIVTHNLLAIVLNFGWTKGGTVLGVARGRA